jgi:hypothetical protein
LRAVGAKKPVGMIHFDAHTDLYDGYFGGFKYTHGTPFKRAIEEGVLDPRRTVQIGLRGSMYDLEDFEYGEKMGVRIIRIEEAMERGPKSIMEEAREIVGDGPTYVSFDIDMLDPVYAPGTGTPEIGGFTTFQAQQLLRGLRGLHLVGADVVEVSPPLGDPFGSLRGAHRHLRQGRRRRHQCRSRDAHSYADHPGAGRWHCRRDRAVAIAVEYFGAELDIHRLVGLGNRCVVDVLFPRAQDRRGGQGRADRQIERAAGGGDRGDFSGREIIMAELDRHRAHRCGRNLGGGEVKENTDSCHCRACPGNP